MRRVTPCAQEPCESTWGRAPDLAAQRSRDVSQREDRQRATSVPARKQRRQAALMAQGSTTLMAAAGSGVPMGTPVTGRTGISPRPFVVALYYRDP